MISLSRLALVAAATLLPALAVDSAHADSLYLASHSGTSYTYDLLLTSGSSSFSAGSTVSLTGLYGITAVAGSSYANYYGTLSFTSTSVTFTSNSAQSTTSSADIPLFTLTSTSATAGNGPVFRLNETGSTYTGSASGPVNPSPVAPTPEPSSLFLLGSGLCGVAGMLRRRR